MIPLGGIAYLKDMERATRAGFTLIELLVVIAIVAILAAILFPVFAQAKLAAKKTQDLSNMRQIGLGLKLYSDDYNGEAPRSNHTAEQQEDCWVALLRPYIGNTDRLRICPVDPKGEERLQEGGTSYTMNSYVVVPGPGSILNLDLLPRPAETMTTFVISDKTGATWNQDHTHSYGWFLPPASAVFGRIRNDIQPDRFRLGKSAAPYTEGVANYLYADTHVKTIAAAKIKGWADSLFNFAIPPTD